MSKECTICYIIRDSEILLQKKAKGKFGEGKYNGPGGKLNIGEDPLFGAIREVKEETGLDVSNLTYLGKNYYYIYSPESKNNCLELIVYLFITQNFKGNMLKESNEGTLHWIKLNEIPYSEMWEDDKYFLPHVLKGNKTECHFYFTEKFEKLLNYELKVLE